MEIIDIIYKVSAPVTALVTIVLTYYISKMSLLNNKKDCYLQYIIELYYRIEDDSHLLFDNYASNSKEDEIKQNQYVRRIGVNCTLMAYYLKRFPGYYKDRTKFERILIYITYEPTRAEYYDILSDQFEKFCWGIRKNKKYADRYIFNIEKGGYPDENCV